MGLWSHKTSDGRPPTFSRASAWQAEKKEILMPRCRRNQRSAGILPASLFGLRAGCPGPLAYEKGQSSYSLAWATATVASFLASAVFDGSSLKVTLSILPLNLNGGS